MEGETEMLIFLCQHNKTVLYKNNKSILGTSNLGPIKLFTINKLMCISAEVLHLTDSDKFILLYKIKFTYIAIDYTVLCNEIGKVQ